MPSFNSDIRQWSSIAAFTAYLQGVSRPPWVEKICNHNTYIPNELQWHGLDSVESCKQTYISKGWSAGPHLFVAAEAKKPAHRGIFQLTPLSDQGVHAGACNSNSIGIEHVGDFNDHPPSAAQYQLLLAVNRAIMHHWMIPPAQVTVHNECMAGRTCPGKYLTGTMIRNSLVSPPPPPDPWLAWGTRFPLRPEQREWAIPKAWFANRVLGACVRPEEYLTPALSVAVFERGMIYYVVSTRSAHVAMF